MPIINLIQEQRRLRQAGEQQSRMAFMALMGVGVVCVLGFGIIFYEKSSLASEIARISSDLDKSKPIVEQIDANEKLRAQLQPRLDSLTKATEMTNRWATILKNLETQTPGGIWLTGLQSTNVDQNKPTNLIFTGTGTEQQPIAEFVLRVQNESNLDNVALHFTQEKRSNTGKAIDFEIAGELVGSMDAKKAVLKEDTKS